MAEAKRLDPDTKAPAPKEAAPPKEPSETYSGAPGGDVSGRKAMPPPDDHLSAEPQAAATQPAGSALMIVKEGTNYKPYKTGDAVYLTDLQQQQWADRFDPAPPGTTPTPYPGGTPPPAGPIGGVGGVGGVGGIGGPGKPDPILPQPKP